MARDRRRGRSRPPSRGDVRIIGGAWRGRRLPVADVQGLRPTADRIRETLFNWLAADISGARCLDLFAGSGALGFEALSRGAAHCTFVDNNREVLRRIVAALETFDTRQRADWHAQPAAEYLADCRRSYDIIFLDPPFAQNLLPATCRLLQDGSNLTGNSLIYVESDRAPSTQQLPQTWQTRRQKRAGSVHYALYSCGGEL